MFISFLDVSSYVYIIAHARGRLQEPNVRKRGEGALFVAYACVRGEEALIFYISVRTHYVYDSLRKDHFSK